MLRIILFSVVTINSDQIWKNDPVKIKSIRLNSELINIILSWGAYQPSSKEMPNGHFSKDQKNK